MAEEKKGQIVEYMVGSDKVKLGPETVKKYLVSGDSSRVSHEECVVFMNLCRFQHLNPWAKEAYLIKFGNEPATMVVSKEAFQKRAEANAHYDGAEAGIVVQKDDGTLEYRKGMLYLEGEKIVGGYAEVWRKDRQHSTRIEVTFDEYAGKKNGGQLNSQWSKKPATMIRKVALAQALREAFPADFGGLYTAEEQGVLEPEFTQNQPAQDASEPQDPFDAAGVIEAEVVDAESAMTTEEPVYEPVEEEIDITA